MELINARRREGPDNHGFPYVTKDTRYHFVDSCRFLSSANEIPTAVTIATKAHMLTAVRKVAPRSWRVRGWRCICWAKPMSELIKNNPIKIRKKYTVACL